MEFILSKFCIGSISPATVIWVNIIAFIVHSLYLLGESQFFFFTPILLGRAPRVCITDLRICILHHAHGWDTLSPSLEHFH